MGPSTSPSEPRPLTNQTTPANIVFAIIPQRTRTGTIRPFRVSYEKTLCKPELSNNLMILSWSFLRIGTRVKLRFVVLLCGCGLVSSCTKKRQQLKESNTLSEAVDWWMRRPDVQLHIIWNGTTPTMKHSGRAQHNQVINLWVENNTRKTVKFLRDQDSVAANKLPTI